MWMNVESPLAKNLEVRVGGLGSMFHRDFNLVLIDFIFIGIIAF